MGVPGGTSACSRTGTLIGIGRFGQMPTQACRVCTNISQASQDAFSKIPPLIARPHVQCALLL